MTEQAQAAEQQEPEPILTQVDITNGLADPIDDMFNGVPYIFPPGVAVTVSPDVARHCFGYPGQFRDMAQHMARRFGWATAENLQWTAHKTPKYVDMASKIQFTPVFYRLQRIDPDKPIPADVSGEDAPPAMPSEGTSTVVGRRNKYRAAVREKREKSVPKNRGERANRRSGRTPHINVTEA